MDGLYVFLLENKEWLLSGVAIAVISISANILTKAIFVSHILAKKMKSQNKVTIKFNGVEISVASDEKDTEQIKKMIMEITGNDFVDPELPNKKIQQTQKARG